MRIVFFFVITLAAPALVAQDGGVFILSPEPLYPEGLHAYTSYGFKSSFERQTERTGAANPDDFFSTEHRFAIGGSYGLPSDLIPGVTKETTLSLNIPYYMRRFRRDVGGTIVDDSISGFGDIGIFLRKRYLWWVPEDTKGIAHHFSAAAGLEFPTGSTSKEVDDVLLPRSLQPGRGGLSATFASMMAFEFDHLEIFSTSIYRMRTFNKDDFDHGDSFSHEIKAAYRIVEEEYPGQSISPSLALRYSVSTPNEVNGVKSANSGSRNIDLAPGVVWHVWAWNETLGLGLDLKLQMTIPLFQDVNGTQGVTYTSLSWSAGFRF